MLPRVRIGLLYDISAIDYSYITLHFSFPTCLFYHGSRAASRPYLKNSTRLVRTIPKWLGNTVPTGGSGFDHYGIDRPFVRCRLLPVRLAGMATLNAIFLITFFRRASVEKSAPKFNHRPSRGCAWDRVSEAGCLQVKHVKGRKHGRYLERVNFLLAQWFTPIRCGNTAGSAALPYLKWISGDAK